MTAPSRRPAVALDPAVAADPAVAGGAARPEVTAGPAPGPDGSGLPAADLTGAPDQDPAPGGSPPPPAGSGRPARVPPGAFALRWRRSRLGGWWRRSLRLRVVASTLALSTVVVGLLGVVLMQQIRDGLLSARERSAVADSALVFALARTTVDASNELPSVPEVAYAVARAIAAQRGATGEYGVILLAATPGSGGLTVPDDVLVSSVPPALTAALRAAVDPEATRYAYGTVSFTDAPTVPAIVVGSTLDIRGVLFDTYYLAPLTRDVQTLALVQGIVAGTGLVLVLLFGAIAALVTGQAVTPVRQAARTAERLAAGDLGERMPVRGEDDLARLATSFNRMARALQRQIGEMAELSRLQQRFVSDVSHELRTPLTTIRMAADVLHEERAAFPPGSARAAELLQAQLDRFESLLADLLEISRYDAGAARLDPEIVDVGQAVRTAVEAIAPLAQRRGSALLTRLPDGPLTAEVDPRRMERVLRNLVVNAVEHGEGRPVLVAARADDAAVAVAVRDLGIGLDPDALWHVFDRFWRADPSRARSTGGTGLGLSISLEDARLHGGWLHVWGAPGRGAVFRLTVPRTVGGPLATSPLPLEPVAEDPVLGLPDGSDLLAPGAAGGAR